MEAQTLAQQLGGKKTSSGWTARCPSHDDQNPSLSIASGLDGKILFKCHAGCSQDEVIDGLRRLNLWPQRQVANAKDQAQWPAIWDASTALSSLSGTPAHRYLTSRGLGAEPSPAGLAYHPALAYFDGEGVMTLHPALVAKVTDVNGEGIGVHRTYLDDQGRKARVNVVKKLLGKANGGAVHLDQSTTLLCLAEGLETALAVREATRTPTWSTISAGGMRTVDIPKSVKQVHIWYDLDANNVGLEAATALAKRLHIRGVVAYLHRPPGELTNDVANIDWADVYVASASSPFTTAMQTAAPWSPPPREGLLVCLDDIEEQSVSFLAYPYLPRGKVTLLVGDGGVGKSWISLALATDVSLGRGLMGTPEAASPGNVVVMNTEDGLADTIKARLTLLGANQKRIFAPAEPLTFDAEGFAKMEEFIRDKLPSLVTIDPVQAFLGGETDMNRANQVRARLTPLIGLAERFGCAIVVVGHLNKDGSKKAIHRFLGSVDFGAAVRSILLAGTNPSDETDRGIFHIKSNLARTGDPIGYDVGDEGLAWTGPTDLTLERVLSAPTSGTSALPASSSALGEAEAFLLDELHAAAQASMTLTAKAKSAGISQSTLNRAKRALGVISKRVGDNWEWRLPSLQDAQGAVLKKLEHVEHLDHFEFEDHQDHQEFMADSHDHLVDAEAHQ